MFKYHEIVALCRKAQKDTEECGRGVPKVGGSTSHDVDMTEKIELSVKQMSSSLHNDQNGFDT